jgi:hypothetical protein
MDRRQGHHQTADVGEHVACVGHQGEGPGGESGDDLDHGDHAQQGQRCDQPTLVAGGGTIAGRRLVRMCVTVGVRRAHAIYRRSLTRRTTWT